MRSQTEARAQHLAAAQAKQHYTGAERESWRGAITDEQGRTRHFAYQRPADPTVTEEIEQWGKARQEWFEKQKRLEEVCYTVLDF